MHIVAGDVGWRHRAADGGWSPVISTVAAVTWILLPISGDQDQGISHSSGAALKVLKNSFDKTNIASEALRMEERCWPASPHGTARELQSLKDGMNVHGALELF